MADLPNVQPDSRTDTVLSAPDRNGGDRAHESELQKVIAAYQHRKGAAAFA